jgi:alpha-N-acetylglucosamine transferase
MPTTIITTDDLREFKLELMEEIEALLKKYQKPANKKWLRSKGVRKKLTISHNTLQNLRNKRTINTYKLDSLIYYDGDEIDKLLLDNMVGKTAKQS